MRAAHDEACTAHQTISTTTITVVICMIRSALSLDSRNAFDVFPPEISVTKMAKHCRGQHCSEHDAEMCNVCQQLR